VRLSAAGVDVDVRIYPASPHGFTGHATSMARAATDDIEGRLLRHLHLPVATRVMRSSSADRQHLGMSTCLTSQSLTGRCSGR